MASARRIAAQMDRRRLRRAVRARSRPPRASMSSCRISAFWRSGREDVLGIVATHAHEDHIGAIAPSVADAQMPDLCHAVHRRPDRRQAGGSGACRDRVRVKQVPLGGIADAWARSQIDFISITHSIPEPNLLAIRTPLGPDRPYRRLEDRSRSAAGRGDRRRRASGSWAMKACWRWSAIPPMRCMQGHSGSEAKVRESLIAADRHLERPGRGHGLRLQCGAAGLHRPCGASAMAASSRWWAARCTRSSQAARDTGYLKDFPPVLDEAEAARACPPRKVLYLCTGSQGEPRAALARIAEGNHPNVQSGQGRCGDLFLPHHSRQRTCRSSSCTTSFPRWASKC